MYLLNIANIVSVKVFSSLTGHNDTISLKFEIIM